jgi:aerobic-type carbon monoxide dehydrogenase small subunit (CoxS/CutS family)
MRISFHLNGKPAAISTEDPQMPLLYALRNDLALRGEPAAAVVPAAIANAVFDATGARLRSVPMTPAKVLAALRGCTSILISR